MDTPKLVMQMRGYVVILDLISCGLPVSMLRNRPGQQLKSVSQSVWQLNTAVFTEVT